MRCLFVALAVTLLSCQFALADTVRTESGVQSGSIGGSTRNGVQLSKGGSPIEIPSNEIIEVSFDSEPFEVKTARKNLENGQYSDAIDKLKGVEGNSDLIKQEIEFITAYSMGKLALAGAEEKAAAAKALLAFASNHSNSFHFYDVARMLGDLAVSAGDNAAAARYYGSLLQAPWPDYKMQAQMLQGRAQLAQGDAAAAIAQFDQVLQTNASVSGAQRQKSFAAVGKAQALAATGKPAEGVQLVEKVIADSDPQDTELFGRAYNALGTCHQALNKPKDALLAFLHTDILFYQDPETHAEALYHLSNLWKAVNSPNEATAARNLLSDRYPGSTWANK